MIVGQFHEGSGLGNQLFRYIFTRVKALDLGVDFGMLGKFKGDDFLKIDKGVSPVKYSEIFEEKKVIENGIDIRGFDPETVFIQDNTLVDGEFQDERYFSHRFGEIKEWLRVEPLKLPDNVCVINFRGGEYVGVPDLFLTKDYWQEAINLMKSIKPDMEFQVHTDDIETAREFFPDYSVIHDMALNWRAVRYAKYVILSNSSFGILPALFNEQAKVIAPRYWARRNKKVWALPQNYYRKFIYI